MQRATSRSPAPTDPGHPTGPGDTAEAPDRAGGCPVPTAHTMPTEDVTVPTAPATRPPLRGLLLVASGAEQREFARWPDRLHAGQPAPEIAGTLLDTGGAVALSSLWKCQTVAVEVGSFS